jgi:hypothetical protein
LQLFLVQHEVALELSYSSWRLIEYHLVVSLSLILHPMGFFISVIRALGRTLILLGLLEPGGE